MDRNICEECKNCEYKDKATLEDCFAICDNPLNALKEIENRRNREDDTCKLI